jgi:hypothetical protein
LGNIVRDMLPFDGRVALLFQVVSFLGEALETLRELFASGREVLERNNLLLIGVNETLQLPLQVTHLGVDTIQLFLELALLPLLHVLPQGIFLQNTLRVLEQLADQGPHQRIQTVGTHTPGGTTLHAPHGHGVLAGTAIIQILIALADAELPRRLHMQLTLATPHEGPQEIPLRRGLIGAVGFGLITFELLLSFRKSLGTDNGRSSDGHPFLWGTGLSGIIVLAWVKFPPGLLARDARFGFIVVPLPSIDRVAEHTAHTGHMPHGVLAGAGGNLPGVQPFDNLPCRQLFLDEPAKHIPYHLALFWVDFDAWREAGLFGKIAVAIRPVCPGQKFGFPRFVQTASSRPVGNLTAFVFGDHPLHLG